MLETAFKAARASGNVLKEYYRNNYQINKKGTFDIVTEVDYKSEKKAIEIISQEYPDHSFLCEERGFFGNENSKYKWVIDPLDGTINFSRHIPFCSVSIGLMKNDKSILSVVYNPIMEDLYHAEKGKGAYLNGKIIRISQNSNLQDSLIVADLTKDKERHEEFFDILSSLSKDVLGIRLTQSTSINLAFTAEGRYDLFIKNKIDYYDISTGILICEEAGGAAIDFLGNRVSSKSSGVIVSNNLLNKTVFEVIQSF